MRILVVTALVLLVGAAAWAQSRPGDRAVFNVGTAKAARGQTATGAIEVPAGSDAAMSIPIAVAHGAQAGPVLALLAGAHGTEYASIIALEKLISGIDAKQLSGTVIIVPLLNVPSFVKIVPHLNPTDGKNMNRMYPGSPNGTQTDRDPAASVYFENTATTRGKPSIIVEAGHAGTVDDADVALLVNGTLSVMRHLKMLPGAPAPVENPVWIDHLADVTAEQSGIFYPLVKRGAYVSAGMKLGYVTDYVGKPLFDARAKESGVVLYVRAVPTINKGETVASVGVVGVAPE